MIDQLEEELAMLTRHLEILELVVESGPIGIVALSNETGHPHHKVRYSLRVLEEEGLVEPTSNGAVPTEATAEFVETAPDRIDELAAKIDGMRVGSSATAG